MKTTMFSLLGMVLLITTNALAQFPEDALRFSASGKGVGTRALGMGNAYIGVADDYTATYWNPAGLAQMRRIEITGGVTNFNYSNTASFLGSSTDGKSTSTQLDNAGFAFPFPTEQGSFVLAFGYNRAADYTTTVTFDGFNPRSSIIPWIIGTDTPFQVSLANTKDYTPITDSVQQTGTVKESGGMGQWAFSGAIDIAKDISFGMTMNVLRGSYKYTRNYSEADVRNVYNNTAAVLPADSAYLRFNKFYYDNTVDDEITGVNFMFGLMYRSDRLRGGLTIKTPGTLKVSETYSNAGQSVFDNNFHTAYQNDTYSVEQEYSVRSPWAFGVGASWEPLDGLLLAADVEYIDWSQTEWTDSPDLEKDPDVGNMQLQKLFRAVTNLHAGVEYEIPGTDLRVRAGFMKTPSAMAGDPTSFDQKTYTGGLGILLRNNVQLDVGAAFGSVKTFHSNYIDQLLKYASRTDESISTTRVNLNVSYRF